jgi:hypoxanthine phosphoribosyltransferase
LPNQAGFEGELKQVLGADQIARRVREMARQISHDYAGRHLHIIAVLENSFIFLSDLIRWLEVPVVCDFIRPDSRIDGGTKQIFFTPEPTVQGSHVLLLRGLVDSGVTTEFLCRTLLARGAISMKVATLLDRPAAHRVQLQPDYFGFLIDESFVFGYGAAGPNGLGRNLPYIAALANGAAKQSPSPE